MTYRIDKVNSYNGWDPLKQVVLGDCYPPEFFEDMKDHKLRDLMQRLVSETREDLDNIQKTLEDFGVDVVRLDPLYNMRQEIGSPTTIMEWFENRHRVTFGQVPKPPITPRDQFLVMGDKFYVTSADHYYLELAHTMFETNTRDVLVNPNITDSSLVDAARLQYDGLAKGEKVGPVGPIAQSDDQVRNQIFGEFRRHPWNGIKPFQTWEECLEFWDTADPTNNDHHYFLQLISKVSHSSFAPCVTRVGDKIICDIQDFKSIDKVMTKFTEFQQVTAAIGGHNDGSINLPRPGLLICAPWEDPDFYKTTFPGWDIVQIDHTGQMQHDWGSWKNDKAETQGRWWSPFNKENPEIIDFVDSWLNEWVGYAEETLFEVNMLSVNPETILSLNYQKDVHNALEKHGVEPIYCRFRHRNFWDGGLHCLTLDTVREGGMQNYF